MAIDRTHFNSEAEAQAFELGLWFCGTPPFKTTCNGNTVTVTDDFDRQPTDHVYRWDGVSGDLVDVGSDPLVSKIIFPTIPEAHAFVSALNWLSTAFLNAALSGATVLVAERRGDGEDAGVLQYDFESLRALIANFRAQTQPTSASA